MTMRKAKPLYLLVVSCSLIFGTIFTANAAQWTPPQTSIDNAGLNIVESFFNTGESISRLTATDNSFTSAMFNTRLCTQFGIAPCDGSAPNAGFNVYEVLPVCSDVITEWCIDGLSIYSGDNLTVIDQAKFIRNTFGPILNKNEKVGLPQGGTISLWNAPGQVNSGGTTNYAVYTYILGNASPNGRFSFQDFRAMVLPYSEKSGPMYRNGTLSEFPQPNGKTNIGINGASQECAWTEDGKCGLMQDFPEGSRAKLSIRVGNSLSGWLMGRMTNPSIEVKTLSTTQNLLTVDSEPATVPKFWVSISKSQITPEISAIDPALRDGNPGVHNQLANSTPFDLTTAWAKFMNDKAPGIFTTWSISTTNRGSGSNCLADSSRLLGIVTTNSMLYEGNAPNFIDDALNYKVFGLHFNPDGSVFQGKYDLLMRSDTARCLYGFSAAPVSANVSITSSSGAEQVATTVLSEKSGWLHLGAYGFTFSNPTIKIKLTQDVSNQTGNARSSAVAPEQRSKDMSKVQTITCQLNKVKKKISGTKPVCPKGYKKV